MQQSANNLNIPIRKSSKVDEGSSSKRIIKRLIEERLTSVTGKVTNGSVGKILSNTMINPSKRNSTSQSHSRIVTHNARRPESLPKDKHLRSNSLKILAKAAESTVERPLLNGNGQSRPQPLK